MPRNVSAAVAVLRRVRPALPYNPWGRPRERMDRLTFRLARKAFNLAYGRPVNAG